MLFRKQQMPVEKKPPRLVLQPVPTSRPQGVLCLRDANSSHAPALLHGTPLASPPPARHPPCSAPTKAPASHRPLRFRLPLSARWFSFCYGTKQTTPCVGSLCPCPAPCHCTERRSREDTACGSLHPGRAAHWCSGNQNLAPCSPWPWERLWYPQASRTQPWKRSPGSTWPWGEGVESGIPGTVSAVTGSRCFSPRSPPTSGKPCPGITTFMSKHRWQRQNLSCVPISFLERALGSSCPGAPPPPPLPCASEHHVSPAGHGMGTGTSSPQSFFPPCSHQHPSPPHHAAHQGAALFLASPKNQPLGEKSPRGSAGTGPAFLAPNAPNGLAPKAGTHRDVTLSSGHDICVSKAVNTDAIPSSVPLLPGGGWFCHSLFVP